MKLKTLAIVALLICLASCDNLNSQKPLKTNLEKPKKFKEQVSYCLGQSIGKNMHKDTLDVDLDYFIFGLRQGLKGDSTILSAEEIDSIMHAFQDTMNAKQEAKMKVVKEALSKKGEVNKLSYQAWLNQNAKKAGIQKSASGLQYFIKAPGTGRKPTDSDLVMVNIRLYLSDGTLIEDTYKANKPVQMYIYQLMPGMKEALRMMKEGAEWTIYIPPELAFGEQGQPPQIPPYAILVYDIKFLNVMSPDQVRHMQQQQQK